MLADLDLLLIAVFCTADDLLPNKPGNAKRIVTDAEVITLGVAQAMMGIVSDERFIAAARTRLIHLFPQLPDREGFYKRRERLSDTIEALIGEFAAHCPGSTDDLLLVDSTPVECARSRETVKRGGASSLADALTDADYGYCASHSRFFYGFRLHTLFAIDGTPRALALTSPKIDEKEVCLHMVARGARQPGQFLTLIGDKNFRGAQFEADVAALDAAIHRPRRKDEPGKGPHLARSVNGSNRSTGPPRTSSPSNATARARCTACGPGWHADSSHLPLPSRSTIASACPAARWSSTPPEPVELLI